MSFHSKEISFNSKDIVFNYKNSLFNSKETSFNLARVGWLSIGGPSTTVSFATAILGQDACGTFPPSEIL